LSLDEHSWDPEEKFRDTGDDEKDHNGRDEKGKAIYFNLLNSFSSIWKLCCSVGKEPFNTSSL
jgi:hypothetical protein